MKVMIFLMLILSFTLFNEPIQANPEKNAVKSEDKGIGPIKEIKRTEIDEALAVEGVKLFQGNCLTCHSLDKTVIGPPFRNITKERTPEFIMNMMLNTEEMQQKNETIKALASKYKMTMPELDLKRYEARAILEYLRKAAVDGVKKKSEEKK